MGTDQMALPPFFFSLSPTSFVIIYPASCWRGVATRYRNTRHKSGLPFPILYLGIFLFFFVVLLEVLRTTMQVTSIPNKRIKRRRVKPIKSPTHTHTQNTHNWWTQTCTHRRAHLTVIQCFARAQPKGRGEKESEKEKIITKFGNVPGDHISRNWPIGGGGMSSHCGMWVISILSISDRQTFTSKWHQI